MCARSEKLLGGAAGSGAGRLGVGKVLRNHAKAGRLRVETGAGDLGRGPQRIDHAPLLKLAISMRWKLRMTDVSRAKARLTSSAFINS